MIYNQNLHQRRSIHLANYNYSKPGFYFVTICTLQREDLFGRIIQNQMYLNQFGLTIRYHWQQLSEKFPQIKLGEFIIMPNHIHGIIEIVRTNRRQMLLPKIIGYLKMNTAKKINNIKNTPGNPVWQRNYYERIIRDNNEYFNICDYIKNNPTNWTTDRNNKR